MPTEHADKFRDLHSPAVVQYILSLDELPPKEEFVDSYIKITKTRRHKRHNGLKMYDFLAKYGLL